MRHEQIYSGYRVGRREGGPNCERFERQIERYYSGICRVFNSATSGLHAGLVAAGIRQADKVVVPAYTMSASASAILHAGATPTFWDIGEDYCLDWESLKVGGPIDCAAVVLVHLFGHHSSVPDWFPEGIPVIHDCAQSPSIRPNGRRRNDVWVYSLNQHKIITTGEGGYVLVWTKRLADALHAVRNHGECFTDDVLGWNYRMTEMQAELGIKEFGELDLRLHVRREWVDETLGELTDTEANWEVNCANRDWFVLPIRYRGDRDAFARRIGGRVGYHKPLYKLPYYAKRHPGLRLPKIEEIERNLVIIDPLI